MSDLISRQAAIDLVRDVCDAVMSGCESWYDPETEDEVYKDIREVDAILKCNKEVRIALRNMPSAQPKNSEGLYVDGFNDGYIDRMNDEPLRWIPCSERLPRKDEQVLCSNKKGSIFTSAYTYTDSRGVAVFGQHLNVIAWMPLPEPYTERWEK